MRIAGYACQSTSAHEARTKFWPVLAGPQPVIRPFGGIIAACSQENAVNAVARRYATAASHAIGGD
jgi:hypothetical protein